LTRRPDDAEAAFDAADRAGRVLMEAFMYRHHPQTRRVAELVRGGAIGRLRTIRAAFSFPLDDPANIRLSSELDGGSLMDLGCYCVSGARLLAGEPERVTGEQEAAPSGVDLSFYGTLRFPGDVVAQFRSSFALPSRQELEAIGEDGSILVQAPWRTDFPGDLLIVRGDDVEAIPPDPADAYRLELENLADAVQGVAVPLLGRADALGQARTIEALYRSAASGTGVAMNPSAG
jgi:predicted dehydrogenase